MNVNKEIEQIFNKKIQSEEQVFIPEDGLLIKNIILDNKDTNANTLTITIDGVEQNYKVEPQTNKSYERILIVKESLKLKVTKPLVVHMVGYR